MLEGVPSGSNVIADKGYDSDAVVALIETRGAVPVIPSRSNRKRSRDRDRHVYRERFLVECLFQKLKRNRRIAMRFEKLAVHFLAMVLLGCILIWAR
jgi:transposase